MNNYDVPIVFLVFKRTDALKKIIARVREIKPTKVYIIADGGRTEEEHQKCIQCRETVEKLIDWPCEIVKNYADKNRGVYKNIAEGAKWVFSKEKTAIFLEDDNLPEVTFFKYCEELLEKYEENDDILWICGTNYLGKYDSEYSYMFTKHMLPCGWASWSNKFLKYYDGEMKTINDHEKLEKFKESYMIKGCKSKALYHGQLHSAKRTAYLMDNKRNEASGDDLMIFWG